MVFVLYKPWLGQKSTSERPLGFRSSQPILVYAAGNRLTQALESPDSMLAGELPSCVWIPEGGPVSLVRVMLLLWAAVHQVFFNLSYSCPSPETRLPWEALPEADAPDNIAPMITEPLKLLHHVKVEIGGALFYIEYINM